MGDLAAYVEFSPTLDLEVNALVQRLAAALHARAEPMLRDIVPALGGIALHFEPRFEGRTLETAAALVEACMEALPPPAAIGRDIEIAVCYDAEFAPDLAEVAARTGLSPGEVAIRHAAAEYRVLMIGFSPGHAYLGGLDPRLSVPRRATPRALVPAGSVAIANQQSVVYPYAISGGWSVIGRTPARVFDAARSAPSLFAPADRVRFRAIAKDEFHELEKKR